MGVILNGKTIFNTIPPVTMYGNYYYKLESGNAVALTDVKNKNNENVTPSSSISFSGIPNHPLDSDYLTKIMKDSNAEIIYTKNSSGTYTEYSFNGAESIRITREMNNVSVFTDGGKIKLAFDMTSTNMVWENGQFIEPEYIPDGTVLWNENRYFASFPAFDYSYPVLKNTGDFIDGIDINQLKTGIKIISNGFTIADSIGYDKPSYPGSNNGGLGIGTTNVTKEQLLQKEKVKLIYSGSFQSNELHFQMIDDKEFKILSTAWDSQSTMFEFASNNTYPGYYYVVIEKIIAY